MRYINKNLLGKAFWALTFFFVLIVLLFLFACSGKDKTITGEELGEYVLKLDDEVNVSRTSIEEFDIIERQDIDNLLPVEILDLISLDYQYDYDTETSEDYDMLVADFVDGRRTMIVRFNKLTRIEAFYMQFQSNLDQKGYTFKERLKYSDICNSFENEDQDSDAYMLKRFNYLIILIK